MRRLLKNLLAFWALLAIPIGIAAIIHGGLGGAESARPMLLGMGLTLSGLIAWMMRLSNT